MLLLEPDAETILYKLQSSLLWLLSSLFRLANIEMEKTKRRDVMNKILSEITVSSKIGSKGEGT